MLPYPGAGGPRDVEVVELGAGGATHDLRPHLTVVLDLEPEHGLGRFEERDRIEGESLDFHLRVREGYLRMAAADPPHYLVLDARADRDEIAGRVRDRLTPMLGQAARP